MHGHLLVFNTSWEDPRIDRALLELDGDSRVVMLTGAGCNVLDYLLDSPAAIEAVDVNWRQNALLEIKMALIRQGSHDDLFALFGAGADPGYRRIYARARHHLGDAARKFWDRNIAFFDPAARRGSFYYRGSTGLVASVISRYIHRNERFAACMHALFDAPDLDAQREIYRELEPIILGSLLYRLSRQPLALALQGVPRAQIGLIDAQYPGGIAAYIRDKLRHVFTAVSMRDNYFWYVYLTGSYGDARLPNYLKAENFPVLCGNVERVRTHSSSLSEFLRARPGAYSHFVLLDHQDWLASHDPEGLREEWRLILDNAKPGAGVLMRSAALEIDFLPDFARRALEICADRAGALHTTDRVGTYGSLLFARVR